MCNKLIYIFYYLAKFSVQIHYYVFYINLIYGEINKKIIYDINGKIIINIDKNNVFPPLHISGLPCTLKFIVHLHNMHLFVHI